MGYISPGSNNGAKDHETEGEEGEAANGASKPQYLTVGDKDDGKVLENSVNRD